MKKMNSIMVVLLTATLTLLFAGQVLAALGETVAGQSITNTASVSFTIGGGSPTPVTGSYDFVVDHKVRPVVGNVSGATVVPNGTDYVLQFTVTNDGNTSGLLEMLLETFAGTSDFPMSNIKIWQETGTTPGFSGDDSDLTLSPYISLGRDTSATIYVVADADSGALQTQASRYHLQATATDGSQAVLTKDADGNNKNESEVIFADDDSASSLAGDTDPLTPNGKHSDQGVYTANWTNLIVGKSATNGGSGYQLPGDIITYDITVTNSDASNAATSVIVIDPIPANTTYDSFAAAGCNGIRAWSIDNQVPGNWLAAEPGTPSDTTDIRCTIATITNGGGPETVSFSVTID